MTTLCPSLHFFPLRQIWLFTQEEKKKQTLRSACGCTGRWTRLKPKTTAWEAVMMDRKSVCVCVYVVLHVMLPYCEWFVTCFSLLMDRPTNIYSPFQFWVQSLEPTCIQIQTDMINIFSWEMMVHDFCFPISCMILGLIIMSLWCLSEVDKTSSESGCPWFS